MIYFKSIKLKKNVKDDVQGVINCKENYKKSIKIDNVAPLGDGLLQRIAAVTLGRQYHV